MSSLLIVTYFGITVYGNTFFCYESSFMSILCCTDKLKWNTYLLNAFYTVFKNSTNLTSLVNLSFLPINQSDWAHIWADMTVSLQYSWCTVVLSSAECSPVSVTEGVCLSCLVHLLNPGIKELSSCSLGKIPQSLIIVINLKKKCIIYKQWLKCGCKHLLQLLIGEKKISPLCLFQPESVKFIILINIPGIKKTKTN